MDLRESFEAIGEARQTGFHVAKGDLVDTTKRFKIKVAQIGYLPKYSVFPFIAMTVLAIIIGFQYLRKLSRYLQRSEKRRN